MDVAHSYLDLPYEHRWEHLKPTIVRIYLDEKASLADLAQRMIDGFSFKAEVHQYRYHFKKWGIKKRTTTEEKEAVITALGKRRRQGVRTSDVQFEQGGSFKPVDKKQLKRHINDSIRRQTLVPPRPGMFLSHNLPHDALIRRIRGHSNDNTSPLSNGPETPAYLTVSSPHNQGSPQDASSPMTELLHKKVLIDRSHLLLSGRELELMKQMTTDERRVTANWLHDFWMFSFVTTKYWGKGPKDWTLPFINARTLALPSSHPSKSRVLELAQSPSMATDVLDPPTQLCNWSIHYKDDVQYCRIEPQPNDSAEDAGDQDIEDESTWKYWECSDDRDLTTAMTQGLQANQFTKYHAEELPLDLDLVTDTVIRSPKDAKIDAIGFAIMTRNVDVLNDLLEFGDFDRKSLRQIWPFHVAAKFLDGSKACCGLMDYLVQNLENENSIGVNYTDDLGMTVLDTLFTSILRSHTSITPLTVTDNLGTSGTTFEGSDIDICGRWDADSPCIRHLRARGDAAIPNEWKHMFCHTSAQAVCHCISAIFMGPAPPGINTVSGLFQRCCRSCGAELKLGTLHAFVLTCFHVANSGMPGETLFGMLACLTSLLTFGADPTSSEDISIPAVLGLDDTEECQHQPLNAAQLASAVPNTFICSWTPEVRLGWEAVQEVLNHRVAWRQESVAKVNHRPSSFLSTAQDLSYSDQDCNLELHGYEPDAKEAFLVCGDTRLGMVWAAIQVELLTYRRLSEKDPWLSWMFEMRDVVEGFRANDDSILRRLVEERGQNAIRGFSQCGIFKHASHPGCVRREEACTVYFANLDDWKRTTFISSWGQYL